MHQGEQSPQNGLGLYRSGYVLQNNVGIITEIPTPFKHKCKVFIFLTIFMQTHRYPAVPCSRFITCTLYAGGFPPFDLYCFQRPGQVAGRPAIHQKSSGIPFKRCGFKKADTNKAGHLYYNIIQLLFQHTAKFFILQFTPSRKVSP